MNPVFPVYTAFNHTSDANKPVLTALLLFKVSFNNPDRNESKTCDSKTEECNGISRSKK